MAPPKNIQKYKLWLERQIKAKKGIRQSKERREITRIAMNKPETIKKSSETKKKAWKDSNHIYNSKEYRIKLANRWKGDKNPNWGGLSESIKEKISKKRMGISLENRFGRKRAKEIKIKQSIAISKALKGVPKTKEHRKKLSEYRKGKTYEQIYRNLEVAEKMRKFQSIRWKGNKNINWTGGRFPHYYGINWIEQKKLAREKSKGKCERCFKKYDRLLDVHHRKPFRMYIIDYVRKNNVKRKAYSEVIDEVSKKANSLSNLICLCRSCHLSEEKKSNKKYPYYLNEQKLKEFLKERRIFVR
jgi:hypothetical protein